MAEIVLLSTKKVFQQRPAIEADSKLIVEKFIEACINMDAGIFEPYMKETDVFEEKDKYIFLASLKQILDGVRKGLKNNFSVVKNTTKCFGCSKGKWVAHFEITNTVTGNYYDEFGFVIDLVDGVLINIYQCHGYRGMRKLSFWNNSFYYPSDIDF